MCQDPDMPLSSMQLVSEADRGHLLGPSWFELRPDLAAGPSVIAAFESQAARQPHARCLVYEGDSMTYEQVSDEWVLLLQACLRVVTNDARRQWSPVIHDNGHQQVTSIVPAVTTDTTVAGQCSLQPAGAQSGCCWRAGRCPCWAVPRARFPAGGGYDRSAEGWGVLRAAGPFLPC